MEINRVGVIGAGQMGAGIAQVCASIGKVVTLCDIKQDFVNNGIATINKNLQRSVSKDRISQKQMDDTLCNVTTTLEMKDLKDFDIIIEAIIEDVSIKKELFTDLGLICDSKTILASNTSSIPIGILAEASGRPSKVVGMHFMNPVPVMKLVEVIRAKTTSDDTRFLTLGDFSKNALKCSLFKSAIDNSSFEIMLCHKSIPFVDFFANITEIATQNKI